MEKYSCKKKHIHLISSAGALHEFATSPIALVSHGRKQVVIQFLSNYCKHNVRLENMQTPTNPNRNLINITPDQFSYISLQQRPQYCT